MMRLTLTMSAERIAALGGPLLLGCTAVPAQAAEQDGATPVASMQNASVEVASADQSQAATTRPVSLLSASSPSNGTSDVSPATVAQNMERLEEPASPFSVSLGATYATGDFGTGSGTDIWSTALGARYRAGNWRLTASLPWMSIRSRSTIFTGIDGIPVLVAPDTSPVKRTADGFGDLTLGAAYTVAPRNSALEIELTGRAKINTAGERSRLSSGENDYALGVEVTRTTGRFAPFVSATYHFLGDTPAYRLRDGIAASAGSSMRIGDHLFALASYHYAQGATRLVDDLHELFFGLSSPLGRSRLRATGFVTTGLSDGAAGFSSGVALSLRL